jgi:elongator complex protein 1
MSTQVIIGSYTSNNIVFSSYPTDGLLILSLHFFPEMRQLVLILANGDIVRYPVDDQDAPFDVVGSFDSGLEAAAWSPDDALLILATGAVRFRYSLETVSYSSAVDGKLVEMSSDFDVLRETDLRPSEFGEGIAKYRFRVKLY